MFRHLPKLVVWSLIAATVWWLWPEGELRHEAGVRINREPVQEMIPPHTVGDFKKYTITAVAKFEIDARILHRKRYWADGEDLVPYDVAVGWGPMSDQAVLDKLSISQCNRFFFYEWQNPPPVAVSEIAQHATNLHIISANKDVASAVKHLRRGEFVTMRGYLVNVGGPDGFYWNTSLTRTDTGNGACEVFYVESVEPTGEPELLTQAH